jgi:hypothetical protein
MTDDETSVMQARMVNIMTRFLVPATVAVEQDPVTELFYVGETGPLRARMWRDHVVVFLGEKWDTLEHFLYTSGFCDIPVR